MTDRRHNKKRHGILKAMEVNKKQLESKLK